MPILRLVPDDRVRVAKHRTENVSLGECLKAVVRKCAIEKHIRSGKQVFRRVLAKFDRNDYLSVAAALAFFFLLSLFPLLLLLSSLITFFWDARAFDEVIRALSQVVPEDAMLVIRSVLDDVLGGNLRLFSIGMLGALIAASGGFSAMIGALNTAYEVREGRPYWKKRLVAIWLTIFVGAMTIAALIALILGPHFGAWLGHWIGARTYFAIAWPYLRWIMTIGFAVLSIELLYFIGPNIKQRFRAQVPGAFVAVVVWLFASSGLSYYLRNLSNISQTYGTLGAVVALMLWLYASALAVLLGAELNAELGRRRKEVLQEKEHSEEAP